MIVKKLDPKIKKFILQLESEGFEWDVTKGSLYKQALEEYALRMNKKTLRRYIE